MVLAPSKPGEVAGLADHIPAKVEVVDERVAIQLLQVGAALTQH
jgi:hypothetical protein